MRVAVPKETAPGERRVALVPETVSKLRAAGFEVRVERGAGLAAGFPDEDYTAAGAELADTGSLLSSADALVGVSRPSDEVIASLTEGTVVIGFLEPLTDQEGIARLRERGAVAFAMESIPRISRAQSMDALSSQATVAGYKAVLLAADTVPRLFPMLMTAAGTIAPVRALVIGAGVAGLQAIATARRLGAVVSAFDVRPAVAEQVESLGAAFLDLGVRAEETAGGYASELDAGAAGAAAVGARGAHSRLRRRDHDRRGSRTPGTEADPDERGRAHASRLRHRRPRRRDGRELRGDGPR